MHALEVLTVDSWGDGRGYQRNRQEVTRAFQGSFPWSKYRGGLCPIHLTPPLMSSVPRT